MKAILAVILLGTINNVFALFPVVVDKVLDGDTIMVHPKLIPEIIIRVRLYGIDAPEKTQEYGIESAQKIQEILTNKAVFIQIVGYDMYGRAVGKVYADNEYVNLTIIKEGCAWFYQQYAPKDLELRNAFETARSQKIGMWKKDNVIAPDIWRKQQRELKK